MFVDKYTGRVKWLNLFLAKIGIIGAIFTGMHYGAHYSPYIQNAEIAAVHGLRRAEEGHYRGDAQVEVVVNKEGNLERHLVFMPSDESYAIGEDGYPKEPSDLIAGLEKRLISADRNQADDIIYRIRQLEQKYSGR